MVSSPPRMSAHAARAGRNGPTIITSHVEMTTAGAVAKVLVVELFITHLQRKH